MNQRKNMKGKAINPINNAGIGAKLICTLLLTVWSAMSYAASSAEPWLQKLSNATQNLNYQIGFVILTRTKEAQPYQWRHAKIGETEMEYLDLLNGPGSEAIRVDSVVSYFEPNLPAYSLHGTHINGPLPFELLRNPTSLFDAYDFVLAGTSRILGLPAQQIRIVSKDKTRYNYNIWLDQNSGLLLKLDMVDLQGKVLEQIQVTSFSVQNSPDAFFSNIETDKLPPLIGNELNTWVEHQWVPSWLPVGMNVIAKNVHTLPVTQQPADYMMVSDGLVDVSIYLQRVNDRKNDRIALVSDTSSFLSVQFDSLLITVVGKVPLKTADAIASSIGAVQSDN